MEELRFERQMSSADAMFWRLETDPSMRSTTAAVTLLDRPPDPELLREKLRRAARAIPRLRQRVASPPIGSTTPVWETDPYFDLDYHLRWVRAPGDRSLRAVLDLAAPLVMAGFDRSRPLWEFTVVEGLSDGRAALIQKMHHAITDGAAGIVMMQRVYDLERDAALPELVEVEEEVAEPAWRQALEAMQRRCWRRRQFVRRAAEEVIEFARSPLATTRKLVSAATSMGHVFKPAFEPLSPILRERSSGYRFEAYSVSLDELKAAGRVAGSKLNDAFLAAVAEGWRLYHEHHGVEAECLRMAMPIDARMNLEGQAVGNQLMVARFVLPLTIRDPLTRMRRIREIAMEERNQPGLAYMDHVLDVLNLLPTSALLAMLGVMLKGNDFVTSCVRGVSRPLYIAGARVENVYPFGPTAGTAANITLFSYREQADITLNADPVAVPDPAVLMGYIRKGFDQVLSCA